VASLFSLEGKVALVTGANTGLGQAIAVALARAGADVCGVSRRSCAGTQAAVRGTGRKFHFIEADLSSTEPAVRIIEEAVERLGGLHILVNNAGTIRRADALDFSEGIGTRS
jgi:2-deoxy-D-gluconate 3-dehydrogenase